MSHENIALGLALTGLVILVLGTVIGVWTDGLRSRQGYVKVAWTLGVIAALLFIAATWAGVSG